MKKLKKALFIIAVLLIVNDHASALSLTTAGFTGAFALTI